MDEQEQTVAADRQFIYLQYDFEVRDWARTFGITEEELREAVYAVGRSVENVRQYLLSR